MLPKILSWQAALPMLLLALSVQAHDSSERAGGTEKADCTTMKNMDQSRLDMDDPVMQAMMKKCRKQMHQNKPASDDTSGKSLEPAQNDDPKSPSSRHEH